MTVDLISSKKKLSLGKIRFYNINKFINKHKLTRFFKNSNSFDKRAVQKLIDLNSQQRKYQICIF